MEAKTLALSFALLALFVWASKRLNKYSKSHYEYTPISFATFFLAMIPYALLIVGFMFLKKSL